MSSFLNGPVLAGCKVNFISCPAEGRGTWWGGGAACCVLQVVVDPSSSLLHPLLPHPKMAREGGWRVLQGELVAAVWI